MLEMKRTTAGIPPVLPKAWLLVNIGRLINILAARSKRVSMMDVPDPVQAIEDDHRALKFAYRHKDSFRLAIDRLNADASIIDGWAPTCGRFPHLMNFSGGIATVFPGTAVVESDFSVLKLERNSFRTRLADITR